MNPNETELLPVSEFRTLLNQSINIANLLRGGDFEMETQKDEEKRIKKEYDNYLKSINAKDR